MKRLAAMAGVCVVAACGDGTDSSGDSASEVIDRMRLTNVRMEFVKGEAYFVPDFWAAYNESGRELPLADTAGHYVDRRLRYGIQDSLPSHSQPVGATGVIQLPSFVGRLYLFAPTARSSRELMGSHYMTVQP